MKLKVTFIIAAVYMTIIGIGHLVAPVALSLGVIPSDASAAMVAFIRHYSAIFIGLSLMNWMSLNLEASKARNVIVITNITALGMAAILDVFAVFSGAGLIGLVPTSTNLAIVVAFIFTGQLNQKSAVKK